MQFFDHESAVFRQIALSAKPVFHVVLEAIERHARANLHPAVRGRDSVVENGIVGEVAHGKAVEPFQQARLALTVFFVFHADLAGKHDGIRLTDTRGTHKFLLWPYDVAGDRSLAKFQFATIAAAVLLWVSHGTAQSSAADTPEANPARPTVSTPATLTPVGYLQFENGGFYAADSAEFASQFSLNQVTKITVAPRLQFFVSSQPYAYTHDATDRSLSGNAPGDVLLGVQGVILAGKGIKPTIGLSYARRIYEGSSPNTDIGSSSQDALILLSADVSGFHFDTNGIFAEQSDGIVRRAQFGQTLSISHVVGKFTLAGELWHFTQPLSRGNAAGNLWALSYPLKKNLVLDAGFDHGLTSSSTQWEGFAGFTYLLPKPLWKRR